VSGATEGTVVVVVLGTVVVVVGIVVVVVDVLVVLVVVVVTGGQSLLGRQSGFPVLAAVEKTSVKTSTNTRNNDLSFMEWVGGFEPPLTGWKPGVLTVDTTPTWLFGEDSNPQ
jgi:hypothetical protein